MALQLCGEITPLDVVEHLAPTWDDDPLWDRLTAYIVALPEDAQRRILTATAWRAGDMLEDSGARCLVGHAADYRYTRRRHDVLFPEARYPACDSLQAALDFDALVDFYSLPRCVARVQQVAADALAGKGGAS